MGAHVFAVPNHQIGRTVSLEIRGGVTMSGNLGYELDLTVLKEQEKKAVRNQISWYKEYRYLIQYGNFHRLISPFNNEHKAAWMFVNDLKDEALLYYYQTMVRANDSLLQIKLVGLDPERKYRLNQTSDIYYGDELMYRGIFINHDLSGDFQSKRIEIKAVD